VFRRGRRKSPEQSNPLPELRLRALHANPAELGMAPTERFPNVFGVVMDTTYPNGIATLVALADGTTSLYTNTGFGVIGGGSHANVVRAGRALLRAAEEHWARFVADDSDDPPPEGRVTLRLLTYEGRRSLTDYENALGEGRSDVSPIFHAAHAVIAELRQIDETRQ
jgi:hypothetical protein